jgi:hypothetical protein
MYAQINDNTIIHTRSSVPDAGSYTLDGVRQCVAPLRNATVDIQQACGWYEVTETDPPAFNPQTQVSSSTVELVDGTPTRVWTVRDKTAEELQAMVRDANLATLSDVAVLATKIADIKTFLTDPDVVAAEAQPNATALTVQQQNRFNKAVARQLRRSANVDVRLFRYVFGQLHPELLDDISDTT